MQSLLKLPLLFAVALAILCNCFVSTAQAQDTQQAPGFTLWWPNGLQGGALTIYESALPPLPNGSVFLNPNEFTVVLDAQPTSDVSFTIVSNDTGLATVTSSLTFTASNWDTPQTVTVTGVDIDNIVNDPGMSSTSIDVAINDGASADEYDSVATQSVVVNLADEDIWKASRWGFEIVDELGYDGIDNLVVSEAGSTDTFTFTLVAQPNSNVLFSMTSSDTSEVTVSPSHYATPTSWAAKVTATLTGVDDGEADGDQVTTITLSVNDALSDPYWHDAPDITFTVTTTDDEVDNDGDGFTDDIDCDDSDASVPGVSAGWQEIDNTANGAGICGTKLINFPSSIVKSNPLSECTAWSLKSPSRLSMQIYLLPIGTGSNAGTYIKDTLGIHEHHYGLLWVGSQIDHDGNTGVGAGSRWKPRGWAGADHTSSSNDILIGFNPATGNFGWYDTDNNGGNGHMWREGDPSKFRGLAHTWDSMQAAGVEPYLAFVNQGNNNTKTPPTITILSDQCPDTDGDGVYDYDEEVGCENDPDCDDDGVGDLEDPDDLDPNIPNPCPTITWTPEFDDDGFPVLDGLSQTQAISIIENSGWTYRYGSIDGMLQPVTEDLANGRYTLTVNGGCLISYYVDVVTPIALPAPPPPDPEDPTPTPTPTPDPDTDGDGVLDEDEQDPSCVTLPDCDGDGYFDADDPDDLDPNVPEAPPQDEDNDGVLDEDEQDPSCVTRPDCDNDDVGDLEDPNDLDPNIPNAEEIREVPGPTPTPIPDTGGNGDEEKWDYCKPPPEWWNEEEDGIYPQIVDCGWEGFEEEEEPTPQPPEPPKTDGDDGGSTNTVTWLFAGLGALMLYPVIVFVLWWILIWKRRKWRCPNCHEIVDKDDEHCGDCGFTFTEEKDKYKKYRSEKEITFREYVRHLWTSRDDKDEL